jgi:hypothetical protein
MKNQKKRKIIAIKNTKLFIQKKLMIMKIRMKIMKRKNNQIKRFKIWIKIKNRYIIILLIKSNMITLPILQKMV